MRTFFDTDFMTMQIAEEQSFILITLKKTAEDSFLRVSEYMQGLMKYADLVRKHDIERCIIDKKYASFTIPSSLREWSREHISPITKILKKRAFVNSENIFAQISTEDSVGEYEEQIDGETKFFDTIEEARAWIDL